MMQPHVVAEARHDLSVNDAASCEARRLTIYTGSIWLAPPPQISAPGARFMVVSSSDVDPLNPSRPLQVFLPDSHPYRSGAQLVMSASGAPIGGVGESGTSSWLLYPLVARLCPDPRGGDRAWVALELRGRGRLHAVTYTVAVTAPTDAVS